MSEPVQVYTACQFVTPIIYGQNYSQVGNKYELTSALIGQKSDLTLPPNSGEDVSVFYSQLGNNFARIL